MLTDMKYYAIQIIVLTVIYCTVIQSVDLEAEYLRTGRIPEKPEKCHGTDEVEFANCCIIPPFFSREIAIKCGTVGAIRWQNTEQNVTGLARIGFSCESWTCILDSYNLLVDEKLEDKKFNKHMERWVKLNPEFKEVTLKAKKFCRRSFLLNFPMDPCDYFAYHDCYRNYFRLDCPLMINSPTCELQKKFYEECREYFLKK